MRVQNTHIFNSKPVRSPSGKFSASKNNVKDVVKKLEEQNEIQQAQQNSQNRPGSTHKIDITT